MKATKDTSPNYYSHYGAEFSLQTQTYDTHKTETGGILSILGFALFALCFYIFYSELKDTTKPKVTFSQTRTQILPSVDLLDEKIFLAIGAYNDRAYSRILAEDMSRYFTIRGNKRTTKIDRVTGERSFENFYMGWNFCKELVTWNPYVQEAFEGELAKLYLNYSLCPDPPHEFSFGGGFIIQGGFFSDEYSRQVYEIFPCSDPDPSRCASLEELKEVTLVIPKQEKSINFKSKLEPIKTGRGKFTQLYIHKDYTTVNSAFFNKNIIYDEDEEFMEAKKSFEYFTIDLERNMRKQRDGSIYCTPESIEANECQPYVEIQLRISNTLNEIHRTYPKIFGLVSELGGFADIIYFTFWILMAVIFWKKKKVWIENEILGLDDEIIKKNKEFIGQNFGVGKEFEEIKRDVVAQQLDCFEIFDKKIKLMDLVLEVCFDEQFDDLIGLAQICKIAKEGQKGKNGTSKPWHKKRIWP